MSEQPWKTQTVYIIEYGALEDLIQKHLGIRYNIHAGDELVGKPGRLIRIGEIPGKFWNETNEKTLQEFLAGRGKARYMVYPLFHELNRLGILPDGTWLLDIGH